MGSPPQQCMVAHPAQVEQRCSKPHPSHLPSNACVTTPDRKDPQVCSCEDEGHVHGGPLLLTVRLQIGEFDCAGAHPRVCKSSQSISQLWVLPCPCYIPKTSKLVPPNLRTSNSHGEGEGEEVGVSVDTSNESTRISFWSLLAGLCRR